jgi:predicted RNA-binding Zn ribbon-like protein
MGGVLCFDFINTVHDRVNLPSKDYIFDYRAFMYWCKRLKVLPAYKIKQLESFSKRNIQLAEKALIKIAGSREILYSFFSSIAAGKVIDGGLLLKFNKIISASFMHIRYEYSKGRLIVAWNDRKVSLYEPYRVIIKSAFDVVSSGDFQRIKECSGCGWIFLDSTKNNSRRWCNMLTCGAKIKARRFYQKKRLLKPGNKR